jgi:hypothetical protein
MQLGDPDGLRRTVDGRPSRKNSSHEIAEPATMRDVILLFHRTQVVARIFTRFIWRPLLRHIDSLRRA